MYLVINNRQPLFSATRIYPFLYSKARKTEYACPSQKQHIALSSGLYVAFSYDAVHFVLHPAKTHEKNMFIQRLIYGSYTEPPTEKISYKQEFISFKILSIFSAKSEAPRKADSIFGIFHITSRLWECIRYFVRRRSLGGAEALGLETGAVIETISTHTESLLTDRPHLSWSSTRPRVKNGEL